MQSLDGDLPCGSGGPFSWLDMVGAGAAAELCRNLADRHGARFEPPGLLLGKAADGGLFTAGGTPSPDSG